MKHDIPAAQSEAIHEGGQHPVSLYLKVWGLLFVLSAMSYMVDYFHVQGGLRWTLILVFMLLKANPPWLALSRDERDALYDSALVMIFNRFPSVRLRCFDASAFHGRCSDVLVWDTTDIPEYHEAMQALRQHALLDQRHFEIVDVITSIPDGWRDFEWNSGRACA